MYRAEYVSGKNNLVMNTAQFSVLTKQIKDAFGTNTIGWSMQAGRGERLILTNDVSFIKHKGDFCFDERERVLYYYPKDGETFANTDCRIPVLQDFIRIGGKTGSTLNNVVIQGVTFSDAAENIGYHEGGYTQNQAQTKAGNSNEFFLPNILVEYVRGIEIKDCVFRCMQRDALSIREGIDGAVVQGNIFRDLGGSAVVIDDPRHNNASDGQKVKNVSVINNVMRRTGLANWGSPAVAAYYTDTCKINYNDIKDVPYIGISLGWGWYFTIWSDVAKNNEIIGNKIGRFCLRVRDSAAIYTLGQQNVPSGGARTGYQNNPSVIEYNYIYEQYESYGGLYHDEGSFNFRTRFNVVENYRQGYTNDVKWAHINADPAAANGRATTANIVFNYNYFNNENPEHDGNPGSGQGWRLSGKLNGADVLTDYYQWYDQVWFMGDPQTITNINAKYNTEGFNLHGDKNLNKYIAPNGDGTTLWTNDIPSEWAGVTGAKSSLDIKNSAGLQPGYTGLISKV